MNKINIAMVQVNDVMFSGAYRIDLEKGDFEEYFPMDRKILAKYARKITCTRTAFYAEDISLKIRCDVIRICPAPFFTATCSRTIAEAMSTVQIWNIPAIQSANHNTSYYMVGCWIQLTASSVKV